jgi:gas vesicle protein
MAEYDREEHEGGGGFMMGLLTGTVLGAGLGILLAPKRGSELRTQIGEGASSLGRRASDLADRARESMNRGVEQMRGRGDASRGSGAPASASTYTGVPGDRTSTIGGPTDAGVGTIDRDRT